MSIIKLPTQAELYEENLQLAFKEDQLLTVLNTPPKKEWIKQNKYANNSNYIPVGVIETLLQKIFKRIRVEVKDWKPVFNAVGVTVRLHYFRIDTNEWEWHDGVGAQEIQVAAGKNLSDLSAINKNAVQMALPAAKSYALKDAAEHLGVLFGRDINRKETIAWTADGSLIKSHEEKERQRIIEMLPNMSDKAINNLILQRPEYADLIKSFKK